jgi:hypothetical protein
MNKRQYERYIVEFPARFVGDCEGTGIVYNLGMGACKFVMTDQPLTIGGMMALALNVPKQALSITLRMATMWWMLQYKFGIEFLGMEELQRESLAQYPQSLAAAAA